ncbi:MAG: hypothetical protein Q9162_005862 [Coniocarpon cinnabarinum]
MAAIRENQNYIKQRLGHVQHRPHDHLHLHGEVGTQKGSKVSRTDSASFENTRSKKVFQIAQYNWLTLPIATAVVFSLAYHYCKEENGGYVVIDHSKLWTTETLLFTVLVLPGQFFWVFGFLGCFVPVRPYRNSQQPVKRSFNRLLVCLVTRGDQKEIVRRSVTSMQDMIKEHSDRISLHIVTEERNAGHFYGLFEDHVRIHAVPADYRALKAKYKARSLEWFRLNMPVNDDDWVLHLDEESIMDDHGIEACLDFMTRQTETDIGTGVIHYNSDKNAYWSNTLLTLGDIGRVHQDWGRLLLQTTLMHNAALGIHGAFMLVRGAVENAATWETDILTEDYWFLLQAMKHGHRIGWVPGICREISPATLTDYVKQRRRWFSGIRQIDHLMGRFVLFSWSWIVFKPV